MDACCAHRASRRGYPRQTATPTEAAFVKARDRTCRAPGCRRPAMWSDLDHRRPWSRHGPSHRANLCSLCDHHHGLRHEHGYLFHQVHIGTWLMESPSGRQRLITPNGELILTAEDDDPEPSRPPPRYTPATLTHPDDEACPDDDESGRAPGGRT